MSETVRVSIFVDRNDFFTPKDAQSNKDSEKYWPKVWKKSYEVVMANIPIKNNKPQNMKYFCEK